MKSFAKILLLVLFITGVSFADDDKTTPKFSPDFPMLIGEEVMFMWLPVPGAVKYRIYRDGVLIGETPEPPFTFPAPTEPGTYKYTVAVTDDNGVAGPRSKEGLITIESLRPPIYIQHRFFGKVLYLSWDAVQNAIIYDIYRSDSKNGYYELVTSAKETEYVDNGVKLEDASYGRIFYYKIVTRDKVGKASPESSPYEVKIEEPLKEEDSGPSPALKIRRSKLVVAPLIYEPQPVSDAKFLNDKKSLVYTDVEGQKVIVLDENGEIIQFIEDPEQVMTPFKLAIDEDDNIYVTDAKEPKIFAYTKEGILIYAAKAHLVTEGDTKGKLDPPKEYNSVRLSGMDIYNGKLYIAERESGTIQIYDKKTGRFEGYLLDKEVGRIPSFGDPTDILIDKENSRVFIGRMQEGKLSVVDLKTGKDLYSSYYNLGRSENFVGAFAGITGICFDNAGNLVVADSVFQSIQVFNKDNGEYMYHIGDGKAIPDKRTKGQRPYVSRLGAPAHPLFDYKGRLWVYSGKSKGYMIREFIDNDIWDASVDNPEGPSPR
jgi:hypothetical protein